MLIIVLQSDLLRQVRIDVIILNLHRFGSQSPNDEVLCAESCSQLHGMPMSKHRCLLSVVSTHCTARIWRLPLIRPTCLFVKWFWGTRLKSHDMRLKKQNLCFAFFLAAWGEDIFLGLFRNGWQSSILIHILQAFLGTLLEIIFGIQKSIMSFYFSNPWDFRSLGSYFLVCPFIAAIYFLCIIFII